jgi:alcohol dehydrogenase class IV
MSLLSLFSRVRVEPTDSSFKDAIQFAQSEPFDAYVAVGYADHVLLRPRTSH